MDIKKLIEQLRWWADHCDRTNYGCHARPFLLEAATALSTLQEEFCDEYCRFPRETEDADSLQELHCDNCPLIRVLHLGL